MLSPVKSHDLSLDHTKKSSDSDIIHEGDSKHLEIGKIKKPFDHSAPAEVLDDISIQVSKKDMDSATLAARVINLEQRLYATEKQLDIHKRREYLLESRFRDFSEAVKRRLEILSTAVSTARRSSESNQRMFKTELLEIARTHNSAIAEHQKIQQLEKIKREETTYSLKQHIEMLCESHNNIKSLILPPPVPESTPLPDVHKDDNALRALAHSHTAHMDSEIVMTWLREYKKKLTADFPDVPVSVELPLYGDDDATPYSIRTTKLALERRKEQDKMAKQSAPIDVKKPLFFSIQKDGMDVARVIAPSSQQHISVVSKSITASSTSSSTPMGKQQTSRSRGKRVIQIEQPKSMGFDGMEEETFTEQLSLESSPELRKMSARGVGNGHSAHLDIDGEMIYHGGKSDTSEFRTGKSLHVGRAGEGEVFTTAHKELFQKYKISIDRLNENTKKLKEAIKREREARKQQILATQKAVGVRFKKEMDWVENEIDIVRIEVGIDPPKKDIKRTQKPSLHPDYEDSQLDDMMLSDR
ncbi:hypothetical protein ADUPG1_013329 [Aduncisulcus paluster]|uniref:Uncharacterized protein n=1 Tax=Aduncisulcus paluster TaxID=2918883 RepID=A0ABQ5K2K8_9EUKA|nr:hypothetical protein ADUPG1_013329 [Aduncisulcus paluster]